MMLMRRREWRCDFGVRLSNRVIYRYFIDFVNFGCHVQASQLVEPVQVSSLCFTVMITEANMVKLSSSDTKEVLNSLFPSPACDSRSSVSNLLSGSGSDVLKDWLESNDMTASVYIADCRCFEFSCAGNQFFTRWPQTYMTTLFVSDLVQETPTTANYVGQCFT
jgi:hypothetical protein